MANFSQKLGMKLFLTAGHSPFSNGSMERNHYTIDITVQKLLDDDENITPESGLRKTVYAYNSQIRKSGYSPFQIVYGKQSPIPGILDVNTSNDEPLENEVFKKEIASRNKAEELLRKFEADETIKRILAQKPRAYQNYDFNIND